MSVTSTKFAKKVLSDLHLPTSANNVDALLAWMAFEGGHWGNPVFKHNPLNTTQKMPGSHSPGGPAGVQAYPDWKTGAAATVKTLSYGAYAHIRAALADSAPPEVTLAAVKSSPWGTTAIDPHAWSRLADQAEAYPPASGSFGVGALDIALAVAIPAAGAALLGSIGLLAGVGVGAGLIARKLL